MDNRPLEKLTIKDTFLFSAVMTEDPESCKQCIELALGIEVGRIEVSKEKCFIYHPEYKGVRLDVYAKGEDNVRYDVEMQVARERVLEKRCRYYHSEMDMDLLGRGKFYDEMPDVHVIFVCDYDPFGEKKYRYTVQRMVQEVPGLVFKDGAKTTILSTKGENKEEVPEALVKFLEYVALPQEESERAFDDPYVTRLQKTIREIKRSREMGKRYMTLQEYLRDEIIAESEKARKEGIELGRSEGVEQNLLAQIEKKLAKGKSIEQIADEVEESVERVVKLIAKLEEK